jgi:hypothetical protein
METMADARPLQFSTMQNSAWCEVGRTRTKWEQYKAVSGTVNTKKQTEW